MTDGPYSGELWGEIVRLYGDIFRPGSDEVCDPSELNISADGTMAVFSGTFPNSPLKNPERRLCQVDMASGVVRVISHGPYSDFAPAYSPDGQSIAFLSDRHAKGEAQLYLLDQLTGAIRSTPRVDGFVEYLRWSPDGSRVLLGVASHGADIAGAQGGMTRNASGASPPAWIPVVVKGRDRTGWRRAWVYDVVAGSVSEISDPDDNIWEASWCGEAAIVAIVSPAPGEGFWYSARLKLVEIATGSGCEIFTPTDQMGWPCASSTGTTIAFVEAVCSDRGLVAGELRLLDIESGTCWRGDTAGVDVGCLEWRSERRLLIAGMQGLDFVVGHFDLGTDSFTELWRSSELASSWPGVAVAGMGESAGFALIGEGFEQAPQIAVVEDGGYRQIKSFNLGYEQAAHVIENAMTVSWRAPDGLEIEGWLLCPRGPAPHPVILHPHGGPVAQWRSFCLSRRLWVLLAIERGYAVFLPNPRGSSGRGRDFARKVVGDMAGADAHDLLAGLDHLIATGLADPERLGITGGSYGGYLTYWLVTQDTRFTAAVAVAPVSNRVTDHLTSNIPQFTARFLGEQFWNPKGLYFERSPIMHAHKSQTPMLNICGARDRCTPPQEALQFHNALSENGVESVLVTYPEEGHGIRNLPAALDYAARVVAWFEQFMPARGPRLLLRASD